MAKIGKISPIKREYSDVGVQTMQNNLSLKGLTRVPGTKVFKYPYKELDNKYRTGLDPNAAYIKRILDPTEKELEIKRVNETLKLLQDMLGDVDLGPRSSFWNYGLSTSTEDSLHVQPYGLLDADNLFDLSVPMQLLAFSWLRVHPTIASSYQAYERGEYPADTQFYVSDEEIETAITFKKKQSLNQAIAKFEAMTPMKKRKVARLLGLPVTDNTTEESIYNQVDSILKQTEFKTGAFKGQSALEMFNRYADMKENLLHVKDLVEQAISHSIYKIKPNGRVYEGEFEIADAKDTLVKTLMEDDNQDMLLTLEGKLKTKKIAIS